MNKNKVKGAQNFESCTAKPNIYPNECGYKISKTTVIIVVEVSTSATVNKIKFQETFVSNIICDFQLLSFTRLYF